MITAATGDPSFLEDIAPTLVAVVLTGVVGVLAAWLGRQWERRGARDAWLRDKRVGIYSTFVERMRIALDEAQVAGPGLRALGDHERERLLEDFHAAQLAMGQSADGILILGPPEMVANARLCMDAVDAVYDARLGGVGGAVAGPAADEAWAAAWAQRTAFAEAAYSLLAM